MILQSYGLLQEKPITGQAGPGAMENGRGTGKNAELLHSRRYL